MLRPLVVIALALLIAGFAHAKDEERAADSAEITGTFTIPADHANVDGVTLTLILFEYDPRLADAGANKLDEVNIADVSHKKGEATVIEFTVGKGKKTRADRGYYLSARVYRDGDYVYYGTPGQGGIGRVLTEGHPHVVKYTGKRMKP